MPRRKKPDNPPPPRFAEDLPSGAKGCHVCHKELTMLRSEELGVEYAICDPCGQAYDLPSYQLVGTVLR